MMDHERTPPSLFVVLSYGGKAPYCVSVLQLETLETLVNNKESASPEPMRMQVNLQDDHHIVARFREPLMCPPPMFPNVRWVFSPPTVSTEDLYLVPDWDVDPKPYCFLKPPLRGYKFNFRTGECRPIKPPRASKSKGHVVNRSEGHLYFMAHPDSYYETPDPVFECYDPDQNRWKALEPFPDHDVLLGRCDIKATAVLDDTILYNMGSCEIWAYHVPNDKWYIVHVEDKDDPCYDIEGEAVVLDNTIYALTDAYRSSNIVLALSIQRKKNTDGDLVFKCSLRSKILVPGMDQINYEKANTFMETRHLVHLGEDNFCLVRSCKLGNYRVNRYQPIQLTSLKRMGKKSMTVTNICVYEVEIQPEKQFEVRLCFSLPECRTTALKQGKRFLYNLDPCRQGHAAYASKQDDKTDFNPEPKVVKPVQASTHGHGAASERSNIAEHGHSIHVRNLPPDANVIILEKKLKIFGSIKRDGIQLIIDNTPGNCRFSAYVEFESATSKRNAIEASSIVILGWCAEIEDCSATQYMLRMETGSLPSWLDFNYCIHVTDLPPDATLEQVKIKVKRYGPILSNGIRGIWDEKGLSGVFVRFQFVNSKLDAIKDRTFMIHGCEAKINGNIRSDLVSLIFQM